MDVETKMDKGGVNRFRKSQGFGKSFIQSKTNIMSNKILFSLLLFTTFSIRALAQSTTPLQMLIGEWHSTSTTLNGEAAESKWIFMPGFNEHTLELQIWSKQKGADWEQRVQKLFVYDPQQQSIFALAANANGNTHRNVGQFQGANEIVLKYYDNSPAASLIRSSTWTIHADQFVSETTTYEHGKAKSSLKHVFKKQ